VAKVALLEPIERMKMDLNRSALVVGGGLAGMSAALNLADQGFKTYLLEKGMQLGGHARNLKRSWKGEDVQASLADLQDRIMRHGEIEVLTRARMAALSGSVGQFTTTVDVDGSQRTLEHGVAILAPGAHTLAPDEYLFGRSDRVTQWHELLDLLESDPRKLEEAEAVAFIQCVGSREPQRPYCSKFCCTASVQQAIELKTRKPDLDVFILYRDLRTYGMREDLYTRARRLGVIFIRYALDHKPLVETVQENGRERLRLTVRDHILDRPVQFSVDYLNLATAIVPSDNTELARLFKVPLNDDGFFLEAHMKLRPVDFATEGVFVCGMAHYPKPMDEVVAQAQAAAARASIILCQPQIEVEPVISTINSDLCIGCGLCEVLCPFGAIRRVEVAGRGYLAETLPTLCKGCGVCAAACPQQAIDIIHFRDKQILAAIHAGGAAA